MSDMRAMMCFGPHETSAWTEIEALYREEAYLLQDARVREWLELLTEDVTYRAPAVQVTDDRADVVGGDADLGYYDEDLETLRLRVDKMASTLAWTEHPPSRLRYIVSLMAVIPEDAHTTAFSNIVVYQTRLDQREHIFFGEREDVLRPVDGTWRIASRKIVLDRSRLVSENLSIFF